MANAPRIPKIPPLRTDIQEPQQSSAVNRPPAQGVSNGTNTASDGGSPQHRTSKEWYYYWSKVGEQVVQNTQTLAGLVTYGPHAGRPDPSTMPNGAIAVESDRGAIYQNELINGVPTWVYVAGTMWGTLSPDQRPTDLGTHDAGFDFRTTDDPAREFIWSQAQWIEATPARYGTHAARLAVATAGVIDQMLWSETDRGEVTYQLQSHVWKYLSGAMSGTISPDQRPTDLGANDTGFGYRATDQQRQFYWNGTAWVETTPPQNNLLQYAMQSAVLTLTTAAQTVPGATLTLTRAGTHLIIGCFDFAGTGAGDSNATGFGQLLANGTVQGAVSIFQPLVLTGTGLTNNPQILRATIYQQWSYVASSAGQVVTLQAYKNGGTGSSLVVNQSTISALWVSP